MNFIYFLLWTVTIKNIFNNVKKEHYQQVAVELGIDILDLQLTIYDLTKSMKENDKYKSDPKTGWRYSQ